MMNYTLLIENDGAKETLISAVNQKRVAHAYIFEGAEGSGKKTLAHIFACALVCENSNGEPCGKCPHCTKAEKYAHPDIIYVAPKSDRKSIAVEQIRDVRGEVSVKPNEALRKVIIIEKAHTMTPQAQNALLKVLEEPVGDTVFILLCEGESMMLPTILSRAVVIKLLPVFIGAEEYLKRVCPNAAPVQIKEALELSGGILGKAVKIIGDKHVSRDIDLSYEILKRASRGRSADAFTMLDKIRTREELNSFLMVFSMCLVRALKCKAGVSSEEELSKIVLPLDTDRIAAIYDAASSCKEKLEQNANISLSARGMLFEILGG